MIILAELVMGLSSLEEKFSRALTVLKQVQTLRSGTSSPSPGPFHLSKESKKIKALAQKLFSRESIIKMTPQTSNLAPRIMFEDKP